LAIGIYRSKSPFRRLCIAQLKQLCHEANVTEQNYSAMRAAMVASQLRTNNVNDPRVVAAIEVVARERFVPAERRSLAYVDVPVPLGGGRALNAPMATARLLTEAKLSPVDKLLIVGAATGYAAAVAAELVGSVTAVEEDEALLAQAQVNLAGDACIVLAHGPLAAGWESGAPYDAIIIDGAVEQIGDAIIGQLAEGGRILAGLDDAGVTRLAAGRRVGNACPLIAFADVETVRLPGFNRPKNFTF
jgi:protein-L-isoaspartate(D-aspartate) O-methyltransferase